MADLFNTLGKETDNLGDLYNKQATVFQDRFGEFFTYYQRELSSLRDLATQQRKFWKRYTEREQRLIARKEKLFQEGKVTQWEMNEEETKDLKIANKGQVFPMMLPRVI